MDNDKISEAANATVGVARDAGEAASNLTKNATDTGTEYYREGSRALVSTVKEQPLGSLLVAGVVGFMLALVLNRPLR
jgi:ElaB/YqjD/DUF883 family membrane-anchored ribosome-binding protein